MEILSIDRPSPHPTSGLRTRWRLADSVGSTLDWDGFCTGPRVLGPDRIAHLCQTLLGLPLAELPQASEAGLGIAPGALATPPRVFLHSTTPDLNAFEGDVDAVRTGRRPLDFTTYKEARSPYLARPGDLAVGRTLPWRQSCEIAKVEMLPLDDCEHYYLSHALLALAERHTRAPIPSMSALIERFSSAPGTVASLYAFESELQIFLLWLRAQAGLDVLYTDANPPRVAQAWNRKDVLHPTVSRAASLEAHAGSSGPAWLALESSRSELSARLGHAAPVYPGYTIPRRGVDITTFVAEVLAAAKMLRARHGLTRGCLKPSEAGDGARITLDVDLRDVTRLTALAEAAFPNGDAYLLEAQVHYLQARIGRERVLATPSAHIRAGLLAPGLTLQFSRGTSWKGNIYLDEASCASVGLDRPAYREAREAVEALTAAFTAAGQGLVTAGFDVGVGRLLGPVWGERQVVGVQDLNVSFTGAECLRAYMDRHGMRAEAPCYGASRVVRPAPGTTVRRLAAALAEVAPPEAEANAVAAVPDRWGMFALRGGDALAAARGALDVRDALLDRGVLLEV